MKERPFLACDSVARGLREGRQTQHRWPMKPQPFFGPGSIFESHWRKSAIDFHPWQPGDVVWVRECWALRQDPDSDTPWRLMIPDSRPGPENTYLGHVPTPVFRADPLASWFHRWRPSAHMPKWAARTWLKVRRTWVERVQEISEADARAEGVIPLQMDGGSYLPRFQGLWDSLYPGIWERNDWLWCAELELDRERSGLA